MNKVQKASVNNIAAPIVDSEASTALSETIQYIFSETLWEVKNEPVLVLGDNAELKFLKPA